MAFAQVDELVSISKDKLYQAITRYEEYPEFVDGMTKVKVDRSFPDRVRAHYWVSMMKDVEYVLDHFEDPDKGTVRWELVESAFFKKNNGLWRLLPAGPGKTDVHYELDLEFSFPVPGFILSRLVKGNLPGMVKSFSGRAAKVVG